MISLKVLRDNLHIKQYLKYMQEFHSESIEKIHQRYAYIYFKNGDMSICITPEWGYKGTGMSFSSVEYFHPVDEEMHKYLYSRLRLPLEAHRSFTW